MQLAVAIGYASGKISERIAISSRSIKSSYMNNSDKQVIELHG